MPLPDKIVETWVAEKSPPSPKPTTEQAATEPAGPRHMTLQGLLYHGGQLDPRVIGLIAFVVTLILCFVGLAIFR
jgi:hypothetical protein